MKCYSCNHTNPSSSRFCVECGAPFFKRCGNCGDESLFSNKFCPNCGNAFDVKLDALTRYKRKLTFFDFVETYKIVGTLVAVRKNNLYGVFDFSSQNLVIPCEYEDYEFCSKDFIVLKKNNRWYTYNPSTGNKIYNSLFEEIVVDDCKEFARVKQDGVWGIISCVQNNYLIYPQYEEFGTAGRYNYILAKKDGLWGCIEFSENSRPAITIPFEYTKLDTFATEDKPRPSCHKNNKWGVILVGGQKILDFEYDEIEYHEPCGHSLYYLRKGSLWGLYFSGGRYDKDVSFPCIYTRDQLSTLKYY